MFGDLIRILAQVFKSRGEVVPIITPADFFVDGDSDEVQTLVDAIAVQADVTDERRAGRLVEAVSAHFGVDVGVIVNNATGPQPELTVERSSWRDYQDQLDFFVKAPFLLLQAALPGMRRLGRGAVVNIGSEVVHRGAAPFATYVAAKAAMIGLTLTGMFLFVAIYWWGSIGGTVAAH